ncbi:MAG: ABC transporter ATP-binding protein [Candidatus Sericytochromatia bacterium]|nr:ABC transporter ATP-binding protein [Candidatus Tanganyikabacteria bacterium]
MPAAITTESLGKTFRTPFGRTQQAVSALDLDVPEGTIFGLLGPNGAGKTTTILMLLGILHPSGGRYSLFGHPMGAVAARARVGYLPEKFQLPGFLAAKEFLRFQGRLHGLGGKLLEQRCDELLGRVGLADQAGSPISAFSKGMQQRLGLAQALLNDPDLVILDEPTSALDPVGRMDVRALIEDLKRRGKSVLLNSHILSDVERVCDRVAILRKGRLEKQGPIAALAEGGVALHMRVGNWTAELAARLGALGRDLEVTVAAGIAEGQLAIGSEDRVPVIADAIQEAGGRIFALTPGRESLEDVFVRVMREES